MYADLILLPIYHVVSTQIQFYIWSPSLLCCFTSLGMKTPRPVCFMPASAARELWHPRLEPPRGQSALESSRWKHLRPLGGRGRFSHNITFLLSMQQSRSIKCGHATGMARKAPAERHWLPARGPRSSTTLTAGGVVVSVLSQS